jgi:hypothetical protein
MYSMMKDGHTRISNFGDIYDSLHNQYFHWGGRIVAHFIAETLLLTGEYTADILNSLAFVLFTLVLYRTANIGNTIRPSLLLAINMLIFFLQPAFADTVLWITGSANYLWETLIIMSFLYLYIKQVFIPTEKSKALKAVMLLLFGIISGWTNENSSIGLIAILISFIAYYKIKLGKAPIWPITGLFGVLIGTTLMIAAPGNYARLDMIIEGQYTSTPSINLFFKRFIEAIAGYYYYALTPTFIFIMAYWLYSEYGSAIRNKTVVKLTALVFLFGAIVATLAMAVSPIFPGRAAFGIITYLFAGTCILLANLDYAQLPIKRITYTVLIFALMLFAADYYRGCRTLKEVRIHLQARQETIDKGKAEGITDFTLNDRIAPESRFLHYFELTPDSTDWHNRIFSGYNNIHSIIMK